MKQKICREALIKSQFDAIDLPLYNNVMNYMGGSEWNEVANRDAFDQLVIDVLLVYNGEVKDQAQGAVYFSDQRYYWCGDEVVIPGTTHKFFLHPDDSN